ncbi:EAL domain-containing protein [Steroidobacter denitrificans]|uniref:EAL domain-containing protein n=1 Tax=Steroidobacter denitrificans TaxID=465721 RepID=UPI00143C9E8C|nr:EAL domain-containing protein [Steroidobacter denitrificans]
MHRLLDKQLKDATGVNGELDLASFLASVADTYARTDQERRGIVRSMQLMSDEATALTRELRESTASQLQAVVDHVKDVILTVDEMGHIASLNVTGQRVFGHTEPDVDGRPLSFLLPRLAEKKPLPEILERMAARQDDTQIDLTPHETLGLRSNGTSFAAEIAVSKTRVNRKTVFVVCLRDTSERKLAEAALRDSEARYRTLVEQAPEIIVVADLDQNRLVDVNENAVRFFRMTREALLANSPDSLSPPHQPDGSLSANAHRAQFERTLAGETPVLEWVFRDGAGTDISCEVRWVRLHSGNARLIRGSITDITERKRSETLAAGERRVFERLAANVELRVTLEAITDAVERVCPESICAIRMLDESGKHLRLGAGPKLPAEYVAATDGITVAARNGSCAAAVYLRRQVIVADIARDALWENLRGPALAARLHSCWSSLIHAADGRTLGTLALYFHGTRSPQRRDFELMSRMTQLAGIAIERSRAEMALRASEIRYRRLFENVMEGVYSSTREGRFVSVNPALARMVGHATPAELLARPNASIYHDPKERQAILAVIERQGEIRNAEFQLQRVDGTTLTVIENARAVYDAGGKLVGYEGTIADISERKQAETAIFEQKEKAQVTLQSIGDAVITTDAQGCIEYLNPVAEDLTGWESAEAQGKRLDAVLKILNEVTREPLEDPVARLMREGQMVTVTDQTILVNRRGQEIAIQESAAPIRDRAGTIIGAVMVFHDVSKERRLRRALAFQASHDALTGLINRREFENRLNEALLTARSDENTTHVLLYLDLDQFKLVNDTCGHQAGDRLLKQITGILQTCIRTSDTISRLGGDEFGVLLQDCTAERAVKIADSMRQAIHEYRFEWDDGAMNVGVSIGIVEISAGSDSIGSVMSAADVACYAAKDSGRNRVHMYQHGTAPERHREMQWVSRLTRACEENRLELYYQPIVPIGTNNDTRGHYELLVRMRGENGQLVLPAEFIPAAERYNVMPMIDRWVVSQALGSLAHYRTDGDARFGYTLSINLSGTSLNDDRFLEFLINELQTYDLSPGAVCFEITETAAIYNLPKVVHFMQEFRARGCLFSLDDFGSGLSSFMYLKTLPVDYLKIDGQFIHNMSSDRVDRTMVEAISRIGRAMGIKTIAERVESAEVLTCLAQIGIEYAQGFYIAVPQSVEALSRITRTYPQLPLVHSA